MSITTEHAQQQLRHTNENIELLDSYWQNRVKHQSGSDKTTTTNW